MQNIFVTRSPGPANSRQGKKYGMLGQWRAVAAAGIILLLVLLVRAAPVGPRFRMNGVVRSSYSPIVFIPGLGGTQLEAVVEGPVRSGCKVYSVWYRIWMDIWTFFKDGVDCWADNIKLTFDRETGRSSDAEGVTIRVSGWGSTESVEYVDSSWTAWLLGNVGAYLAPLVKELVSRGYEKNVSLRAAPYDFRYAPHSQPEFFQRLRLLIEETSQLNNDQRVLLVSHSMGGIFATYFLANVSQEWKNRYMAGLVTANTPWGGTVMSTIMFTTGYNWEIDAIDRFVMRDQQRTYETAALVLPKEPIWGADEVLVRAGSQTYTVSNYDEFFAALNYTAGSDLLRLMNTSAYEQRHPGVPVYCLYSSGLETTTRLHFANDQDFPDAEPVQILGEGDGTVNLRSLEACSQWGSHPRYPVQMKHFENIKHNDILSSSQLIASLLDIAKTVS